MRSDGLDRRFVVVVLLVRIPSMAMIMVRMLKTVKCIPSRRLESVEGHISGTDC